MNRIYLSFLTSFFFLKMMCQSPISLTNANMPSSGDTLRYSNAKLSSVGNYTQTGTNFNWNFSSLVPSSQGVRNFKFAFTTPYAFFFAPNDYGEKIADTLGAGPLIMTNYYNFYKKQTSPSAYIADGVGLTYNSFPIPNYFSDKDELYNFPMTYPKYDSTTFKFATSSNTNTPGKYSKTGYRVTVVDGWGTITTPYGTAACLRLITTQYSQDSVKTGLGNFGFPNYQRSYQWMTLANKIPFLEISGTLNGSSFTPSQVRYRDAPQTFAGIKEMGTEVEFGLYPNPVQDKIYYNSKNADVSFEILDLNGQAVKALLNTFRTGVYTGIDVAGLKPGLYILRVKHTSGFHNLKFIKE